MRPVQAQAGAQRRGGIQGLVRAKVRGREGCDFTTLEKELSLLPQVPVQGPQATGQATLERGGAPMAAAEEGLAEWGQAHTPDPGIVGLDKGDFTVLPGAQAEVGAPTSSAGKTKNTPAGENELGQKVCFAFTFRFPYPRQASYLSRFSPLTSLFECSE